MAMMAPMPPMAPAGPPSDYVVLASSPLDGLYLEDGADLCTDFMRQTSDLLKIVKIREAEDISDQIYKLKSVFMELHNMNFDGALDGLYVQRQFMESLDFAILNIKRRLTECERLLIRIKKKSINWSPKHDVLVASIQRVWEDFAIEMGSRLRMALIVKIRQDKEFLEKAVAVFKRAMREAERAEIERKVEEKLEQMGVHENLARMEHRLRQVDRKATEAQRAINDPARLLGPPRVVEAEPPLQITAAPSPYVAPIPPPVQAIEPAIMEAPMWNPGIMRPPTAPPVPMQVARSPARSEIHTRPMGLPPNRYDVKLWEKQFDSDINVQLFHNHYDNHIRIMLFENNGRNHVATIWATTVALHRVGNCVLITNHVTSELWAKLAFQSYKELVTFFLYVQALRLLDFERYDRTRPLEKIKGEDLVWDGVIIGEDDCPLKLELYHDKDPDGSNMLRIQASHEIDSVAIWVAFLDDFNPSLHSQLHYIAPPAHMPHHPDFLPQVWLETSERIRLGLNADEKLQRERPLQAPKGWYGILLKFKYNPDAIAFKRAVEAKQREGAGHEKPMAGSLEACGLGGGGGAPPFYSTPPLAPIY